MRALIFAILLIASPVFAEERLVRLYVPQVLVESGLFKFILPRFSLKTQVKVQLVEEASEADLVVGADGAPLFAGLGSDWRMEVARETQAGTRLMDWLGSDVGRKTVFGYAPDGDALFSELTGGAVVEEAVVMSGDAEAGHIVARASCARCHAVDDETRKTTIGSTPSFFVLKTFGDWEDRFSSFYALKPHGAFTQIAEVTEPFPVDRPSPIVPIELTLDEVDALLAYVAALAAADLGAPLQHQ